MVRLVIMSRLLVGLVLDSALKLWREETPLLLELACEVREGWWCGDLVGAGGNIIGLISGRLVFCTETWEAGL